MPAFVFTAVYLVRDLHMSPLQLVLMGTVMEAAVFLFEIPTGVVADTYSRRASLVVSLVIQGLAIMIVGLSTRARRRDRRLGPLGLRLHVHERRVPGVDHRRGRRREGRRRLPARRRASGSSAASSVSACSSRVATQSLRAAVVAGGAVTSPAALACIVADAGDRLPPPAARRARPRSARAEDDRAGAALRYVRCQPLLLLLIRRSRCSAACRPRRSTGSRRRTSSATSACRRSARFEPVVLVRAVQRRLDALLGFFGAGRADEAVRATRHAPRLVRVLIVLATRDDGRASSPSR